jgi:hypothetical protein
MLLVPCHERVPAATVQCALRVLSAFRVRMHTHTLFSSAPCSADTVDTWEAQSASTRSHHFCWNRAEVRRQAAVSNRGPSSASACHTPQTVRYNAPGHNSTVWAMRVWACTGACECE